MAEFSVFLLLASIITLLNFKPTVSRITVLPDPCSSAADYDGTDIARPYLVDNSTGTPVYTYLDEENYHPPSNRPKRGATANRHWQWPQGVVIFSFYTDLSAYEQERILDAMRHWEEKTCIRFQIVPLSSLQSGALFHSGLDGCCSYIGRRYPYVQQVNVGPECSFRSIVHEIGHVIGFWHEENRPDRDEYITIDSQSIILGLAYNFNKTNTSSVNSLGVPYDFGSIMHYYNDSAAKNGTVIITSKEKSMPFGGAPELSSLDIKQTNLLYKKQCGLRSWSHSRLPAPANFTFVILPPGRCNKHLTGLTGRFSPPDYFYLSNTECVWIIEVPSGYSVQVTFYSVEIESPCAHVSDSYVIVYGSHTESGEYHFFCGSYNSYRVTTGTSRFAYVKFHTSQLPNYGLLRGFSYAVFIAEDVDECLHGACDHNCTNLVGSYKCTCKKGYYLAGTYRCFDVDECLTNNGGCSHKCVNTAGTYRCECPAGSTLHSNRHDCTGLHCHINNGECQQICTNTGISVRCSCNNGYQLIDGQLCKDINECQVCNGGCSHTCTNADGSYSCGCHTGYVLQPNNHDCLISGDPVYQYYLGFFINFAPAKSNISIILATTETYGVRYFVEVPSLDYYYTGFISAGNENILYLPRSLEATYYFDQNKGILITTNSTKVTVIGLHMSPNYFISESYFALPVNVIESDDDYVYYGISVSNNGTTSSIMIVATEDNTTLTFAVTQSGSISIDNTVTDLIPGIQYSYVVNKMQTIFIGSPDDLSGTKITTDKPLSVFSGHECAHIPVNVDFCNYLIEQIPPTAVWGKIFYTAPLFNKTSYTIKILAAHSFTDVNLYCNNTTRSYALSTGKFVNITLSVQEYCAIHSNKEVLVAQFSHGGEEDNEYGNPMMTLVPATNQYLNEFDISTIRDPFGHYYSHYVNIVVMAQYYQPSMIKLTAGGVTSSLSTHIWVPVQVSSITEAYATQVVIPEGTTKIFHTNAAAQMSTIVYGFTTHFSSYGHLGGFRVSQAGDQINYYYLGFFKNYVTFVSNISLLLTTTETSNDVHYFVEVPGLHYYSYGIIPASGGVIVDLPRVVEVLSHYDQNKGICLTTNSSKVTVIGLHGSYNQIDCDTYYALPIIKLNDQYVYYGISVTRAVIHSVPIDSVILIVGTEDDTSMNLIATQSVNISVGNVVTNLNPGSQYSFVVNRLQTVYIGSPEDLSGTKIITDKPISAFSGHVCGNVPSDVAYCSHLVEQVPPTAVWGKVHYVAPLSNRTSYTIKILASYISTVVNLYCNTTKSSYVLNTGEFVTKALSMQECCAVHSNKEVLVVQFSHGGREDNQYGNPMMSLVPATNQYLSKFDFSTNPSVYYNYNYYINVIVMAQYYQPSMINLITGGVTSSLLLAPWIPVKVNNITEAYATQVEISEGGTRIFHTNTSAQMTAIVYGFTDYFGSYGTIGGIHLSKVEKCEENNGGCDHTCTDTQSGTSCSCRNGYQLLSDDKSCEDINECLINDGGCSHTCTNTNGSYSCGCLVGYVLQLNNHDCIKRCQTNNGECQHICTNTQTGVACSCRSGFQLFNSQSCRDINECQNSNGGCSHSCVNRPGSYHCGCPSGYILQSNNHDCKRLTCEQNNGGCDQICTNALSGIKCSCHTGYDFYAPSFCIDIIECSNNNGGCSHSCVNTRGSYRCECPDDYILLSDGHKCVKVLNTTDVTATVADTIVDTATTTTTAISTTTKSVTADTTTISIVIITHNSNSVAAAAATTMGTTINTTIDSTSPTAISTYVTIAVIATTTITANSIDATDTKASSIGSNTVTTLTSTPAATDVAATPTTTNTTTTTTNTTTTTTTTTTTAAIIATDTYTNFNTLIDSHTPNLGSQSDNDNSSSIVAVIAAITVLILILCVLIILVMIGIIMFWKSKQHTKPEDTKPEDPYYSTIDETKLQRPLKTKQETVHSEMNDVQVNKEEPTYMEILENPHYTTSVKVTLQNNPSYSVSYNNRVDIPSHNITAKLQDNPSYAISSQTIN